MSTEVITCQILSFNLKNVPGRFDRIRGAEVARRFERISVDILITKSGLCQTLFLKQHSDLFLRVRDAYQFDLPQLMICL